MRRAPFRRIASCVVLLAGCDLRACSAPPAAVVTEVEGVVSLARASAPARWGAAAVDAELEMGDAIRTGGRSTARLALEDGSTIDLEPNSTLRLLLEAPDDESPTLEVLAGAVVISTDDGADIATRGGRARLDAGSRVELRRIDESLTLTLSVGRARFTDDDGGDTELTRGEAVTLGRAARPTDAAPVAILAPASAVRAAQSARSVRAALSGARHELRAAETEDWTTLEEGVHELERGARVRQTEGGSVELADGEARITIRGSGELAIGEAPALAALVAGTLSIESGDDGVVIETPGGALVTRPARGGSARAELERHEDGSFTLAVSAGAIEVHRGGETEIVEAGQSTTLAEAVAPEDDALDHEDFSVATGRDLVVRDTAPPTAIGFALGDDCAGGAVVERLGRRGARVEASGRGTTSVSLGFPAGRHRYQVRCLVDGRPHGKPVARGRVHVMRSSGQAPLPRSAPESGVDADGRAYTVLYQNLLPSITVRWPGGAQGPATLVLRSGDATRRIPVSGPEHRFAAGELEEGAHSLHFEAASGERRSRETSVRIGFDETAASASLVEPATGSFAPGDTVRVSGIALSGWRVVAADRPIPIGPDQRFSGHVVVPASGVLVVKLSKPGEGVHYFVRRAGAAEGGQ